MPYLEGKNEVFQALKPPAVALSQAILSINSSHSNAKLVQDRLETLHTTLLAVTLSQGSLDEKLADYVFFPVSQVLKLSQKVSIRCLELALSVVTILVRQGWRSHIQQQLAQQLFILCTLLASDSPSVASSDQTTPELQCRAIDCLYELFAVLGTSSSGTLLFTSDAFLPQLGQSISTLLQAVHQNPSPSVQESALKALRAVAALDISAVILFNFLPGVVSTLTKVLTMQSGQRRRPELLIGCLEILETCFRRIFQEDVIIVGESLHDVKEEPANDLVKDAAPQIRLALGNIIRLRDHDRNDVKSALGRLCITILRHCRKALQNCIQLALETILALSVNSNMSGLRFEIVMLMTTDSAILVTVQTTLFDWSQSLVRIMQASDDDAKRSRLEQIGSAYQCMVEMGVDLTTTNQLLAQTLRDCVMLTLQSGRSTQSIDSSLAAVTAIQLPNSEQSLVSINDFEAITTNSSQTAVVRSIQDLVELISVHDASRNIIDNLIESLAKSREESLVANLWLSLRYLHKSMQPNDLDLLVDDGEGKALFEAHLEEAYSFALSYLTSPDDHSPMVTSLALQALAMRAQSAGTEFKFELIDALYPVLHSLATPHQTIQHDSMVALNIFTESCGYSSVTDLIVDNVDYLTNAVALKLNSFDVSPQAPQVLLMMVKLAGPRLVPYLEDSIESIFAALEDYHGYPLFVELLFKTLSVVAEEASKAPLLDASGDIPLLIVHRGIESWEPTTIAALAESIRSRVAALDASDETEVVESAPQRPWDTLDTEADAVQQVDEQEQQPPAPKTYNILVRITELTQHFLPSASPALRISLLSLIRTTIPAIARHENTFLPLINTLWPEIVSRLDDDELSIRAATLEIITVLCEHAKDFMRSRITDLWPHIRELWRDVVKEITSSTSTSKVKSMPASTGTALLRLSEQARRDIQRMQTAPADYSNVSARTMWQAIVQLLTVVVRSVPISPEIFDEALRMVSTELKSPDVLAAFEHENADAVWLARLKMGAVKLDWHPVAGSNASTFWRPGRKSFST